MIGGSYLTMHGEIRLWDFFLGQMIFQFSLAACSWEFLLEFDNPDINRE